MIYGDTDARIATIRALLNHGGSLEVRDPLASTPTDALNTAYAIQVQKQETDSAELLERFQRILNALQVARSSPFKGNRMFHRVVRGEGRKSDSFEPIKIE